MTYDNWKCTDPNDQFLGPDPIAEAWDRYKNGDLTLGGLGDVLLDHGMEPRNVRRVLSLDIDYPIPIGYFGKE